MFLVTMGNVNVKVEAILGLMMKADLDISQVLQPPPGHCLESLRSVADLREVLWTHGPVAGGGEDSGPVGRGSGGREPETTNILGFSDIETLSLSSWRQM